MKSYSLWSFMTLIAFNQLSLRLSFTLLSILEIWHSEMIIIPLPYSGLYAICLWRGNNVVMLSSLGNAHCESNNQSLSLHGSTFHKSFLAWSEIYKYLLYTDFYRLLSSSWLLLVQSFDRSTRQPTSKNFELNLIWLFPFCCPFQRISRLKLILLG